jgi:hypothetical protein
VEKQYHSSENTSGKIPGMKFEKSIRQKTKSDTADSSSVFWPAEGVSG